MSRIQFCQGHTVSSSRCVDASFEWSSPKAPLDLTGGVFRMPDRRARGIGFSQSLESLRVARPLRVMNRSVVCMY